MQEEVIREDEYVDICPNCGGLFSQNARGRRKKFCSDKCRTAWNHRHPNISNWKDTSRIRKTSLDELPQLWNVVKGDMAFVGPRSPVVGHFPDYADLNDAYKRRFTVLPGITGLAQVTGRNELAWDEKVKYDNIYIDNVKKYGILYDIKIWFLTFARVFSMKDVEETQENMEKNKETMKIDNQ